MAAHAAEQISPERKIVLLAKSLPPSWVSQLEARNLSVERIRNVISSVRGRHLENPRAIIVHVRNPANDAKQAKYLRQILIECEQLLDAEVLPIILVEGDPRDIAWAGALATRQFSQREEGIDDRFRPVLVPMPAVSSAIAQRCAEHVPGRALADVEIRPEFVVPVDDQIVLKRAFNDASALDVSLLQERMTPRGPSRVYKVRSITVEASSPIYWVVKTLPLSDADSEIGILNLSVPRNTPFANVPPVAMDRCVSTSSRSSIVLPFVDRAEVFASFIETHSPALAIASLFDGPLRCWRSKVIPESRNVGKYGLREIATDMPARYMRSFREAQKIEQNTRTPRKLLRALRGHGAIPVGLSFSHGDLHLGNIFVREGSNEVVLIDFNRGGLAPCSRDPAELDAALAFTSSNRRTVAALPSDVLRLLYARPVLQPQVHCRTDYPRAQAIEQIRRQVVGSCSEDEYRLMLAAHCLWWAKHGNAEAYLAADRLV
jgi:hypothetical protein